LVTVPALGIIIFGEISCNAIVTTKFRRQFDVSNNSLSASNGSRRKSSKVVESTSNRNCSVTAV